MHLSAILPRFGLSALFLCLFSGLVLAFYYRPSGNVFQSVEEITTLVPYGWFFRQLHYGSGQVFVMLMFLHTLDHLIRKRYRVFSLGEWMRLMVSLILCLFVLFSGFMLKGDKEGLFAAEIFTNIMKAVPLMGAGSADLFIRPGEHLLFLPYLYHLYSCSGVHPLSDPLPHTGVAPGRRPLCDHPAGFIPLCLDRGARQGHPA